LADGQRDSQTTFLTASSWRTTDEKGNYPCRALSLLFGEVQGADFDRPRHGDTIYVTGAPPFEPNTGEICVGPIERQTELVLEQLKLCIETAGSSLENILKVNVYVTSVEMFPAVNELYRRYFPKDPPARIFVNVPAWNGGFDIEVDCIAAV
jgi:2-iminobutanoate/2-iminopropanoate deaminase